MTAGRELDALIAEKIFGLEIAHREWPCGPDPECGVYEAAISNQNKYQASWFAERGPIYKVHDPDGWDVEPHELGLWCSPVPFYSTDIAAAFLIIQRMRALGWHCEMGTHFIDDHAWWARFGRGYYDSHDDHFEQDHMQADDTSLPAAICLAALEAIG